MVLVLIVQNIYRKLEDLEGQTEGKKCQSLVDFSKPSSENLFGNLNPSPAISDILTSHQDYYDFVVRQRQTTPGIIEDIYDGQMYQEFLLSLSENDRKRYCTGTLNTDGASPYKFSKRSVWPIYVLPNEIPAAARQNHVVVCGLWFNRKKANMNVFLKHLVKQLNLLSKDGFPVTIKGERRIIKFFTLVCSVDAIARSPIQGTKQFNGLFGCPWCLHPGAWDASSRARKFPIMFSF